MKARFFTYKYNVQMHEDADLEVQATLSPGSDMLLFEQLVEEWGVKKLLDQIDTATIVMYYEKYIKADETITVI